MSTSPASLEYVRELVQRRAGIVLGVDKDYLIDARITTLARELGFASIDAVVAAGVAVTAYGSHVDTGLLGAARAAGCREVLPRSRFFARLDRA